MPRPTLLIGYGDFGLDALQRLLHQSALRGVLRWKGSRTGGVASAQRQLQDLALVALPDPFERSAEMAGQARAGAPQLLTDLYRQIAEVPVKARSAEGGVARFVQRTADALLAQAGFERRDPVGLDLVVLARPTSPQTIPHLDLLLQGCLESLADASFFKLAVQGADNLNCILILDFDDYWRSSGTPQEVRQAADLRSALRGSMQSWERRRAQRLVALDRCYLVDGRTAAGFRPPPVRLDEVTLFLELLLFEDLRTAKQELFQQQSLVQPIAATFGVRLLEESTMVLSRIAAATFGRRWLDALIGDAERCPDRGARRLAEALEPYRPQSIERRLKEGGLAELFEARAGQMTEALMQLPDRHAADWMARAGALYERERLALEQAVERAGRDLAATIKESQFKDLKERIAQAADADLHDERAPASLKLVRGHIDEIRRALEPVRGSQAPLATGATAGGTAWAQSAPAAGGLSGLEPGSDDADPLAGLRRLHQDYRDRLDEWVAGQGRALQWFWPLFALLLALGLAPLATQLAGQIRPPAQGWLKDAVEWLHRVNHPLFWTGVWLPLLWGLCALALQPLVVARIRRAQRFFDSAERGRFADRIRALVAPLRDSILARVERNVRRGLANDLLKTLGPLGERLAERAREMDWLRRQLAELLRQSTQPETAVRKWVSGDLGVEDILKARPVERICYPQDDLPRPFEGWEQRFCDAFLDPLDFVGRLSGRYAQAHERELEKRNANPDLPQRGRELIDFIDRGNLALACRFLQDTGVTEERHCAIAAWRWKNIPGMADELNNRLGILHDDIIPAADRSRLYLLALQTGVEASRLEREP